MHADEAQEIEGLRWLEQFEREKGRPLRVLHIGNIANNAYNNAKIQRRRGIDADVSCHDYYHVMGSPEWEDAEFIGDIVDEFLPDWWNVDVGDYKRPEWFAQGALATCVAYLLARRRNQTKRATALRRRLTRQRWLRSRSTPIARALRIANEVLQTLMLWLQVPFHIVGRRTRAAGGAAAALARGENFSTVAMIFLPVSLRPRGLKSSATIRSRDELAERFAALFPERRDRLTSADYSKYAHEVPMWRPLLKEYDIVQAYATDGAIPFLCHHNAWAAYEHGTLREIPFEETPRGRLCALTYREAPIAFVTNSDVLPSVDRLGLDSERVVYLPHAVDSDRLFHFADEHAHLRPAPAQTVTYYAPSRQDWVDGDASWSKGNDRFLHAAASLAEHPFRLVLAAWGRDLAATRRLLAELGLDDRVEWVPPLRKRELWARYLASHAVVDQFAIRAIGGVAFEAMALGCRVVTAIDPGETKRFFGRTPPSLGAQTVEEIAAALEAVLADPDDAADRGAAGRAWFAEHHSADRIVELQAAAYRRLLEAAHA